MRPIPSRKHHWAALILVTVAAANTLLTFRGGDITGRQANMLAEAFARQDPSLYAHDGVFGAAGPAGPLRVQLPAWEWALSAAVGVCGQDDPVNAFRLLGAVAIGLYLVFMYILVYRQTRSTTIGALVAIISTAIFSTSRTYWGLGPVFAVTPATMYLAFVPLLVTLFVGARKDWLVIGVFFLAGLAGNIHLGSAMNLTAVLLLALVGLGRARWRAWAKAGGSALAALAGAAPALLCHYQTWRACEAVAPHLTPAAVNEMLTLARINVLYPGILIELLWWLPMAAALAVPAAIILIRAGRYRMREHGVWLWLLGGAAGVALGLQGLSQLVGRLRGTPPPLIEFFAALRLAMLPLYVFFAQASVHLFRQARRNRHLIRVGLLMFAVVYLGSSFNTRTLRHIVRDSVAAAGGTQPAARSWRDILLRDTRSEKDHELRALADWARRHTDASALFITDQAQVRPYARRSVLCCGDDVRYFYHFAPQRLTGWKDQLLEQAALLSPPEALQADPERIAEFARDFWQRGRNRVALFPAEQLRPAPTYVVLPAAKAPPDGEHLQRVPAPKKLWGRHWVLLRIRPATLAESAD